MKKIYIVLISIVLLVFFAGLVYYGLRYSRGVPVLVEEQKREILEVPFINKDINLSRGVAQKIWDNITPKEIKLMYQVTILPWPKGGSIPHVSVKAFHNKKDIYLQLTWRDDTEDRTRRENKFSDACAIMFPLKEEAPPAIIMMGFLGGANVWQWKASQDREYWTRTATERKTYVDFYYPFEDKELFPVSKDIPKSAVNDLAAIRVATITPKEKQNVQGRGIFNKGFWNVVFKRSLKVSDPEIDANFDFKKQVAAFAVWDGSRGDRGGRKSISDWVELEIK